MPKNFPHAANTSEKGRGNQKTEADLRNNLKLVRTRLGLTQSDLALAAGVARQTIGGIEASLYAPSAAVALRLVRALGCRLEEVFWLEEEAGQQLSAKRAYLGASALDGQKNQRVLVGQVGEQWIAHALSGEAAFRAEMVPTDGIASRPSDEMARVEVELLDSLESLRRTVLIAGCSPALSLWTRSAQRWHPGLRATWIHANSTQALEALARGEVHLAGVHLCDPQSGEDNVPFVRHFMGSEEMVLLNFGVWDEGLLLASGNPKGIRGVSDLGNENIRLINREEGAGSRLLLDLLLKQEKVPIETIIGYSQTVKSHQEVARTVGEGRADAGMGTAALAQIFGLDFLPLRAVRFDFAVRAATLKEEPVAQLFETLSHKSVRLQLQKLGGYDTTRTGEIIAKL